MADHWFKFHNRARHSRKVNALAPKHFRNWVMLLTLASELGGDIPADFDALGFELRVKPSAAKETMHALISIGLMEDHQICFRPTRWHEMQGTDARESGRKRAERMRDKRSAAGLPRMCWIQPSVRKQIFERDKHQCQICGATADLTIDHIVPELAGGSNEPNNLRVLCRPCNASKRDSHGPVPGENLESEIEKETKVLRTLSKKARKPRSEIGSYRPGTAESEEALAYWAKHDRRDLDLEDQVAQFVDHHLKIGDAMADWPAAWRTWYRNAVKFNRKETGHVRTKIHRRSSHDAHFEGMQLLREELRDQRSGPSKG